MEELASENLPMDFLVKSGVQTEDIAPLRNATSPAHGEIPSSATPAWSKLY